MGGFTAWRNFLFHLFPSCFSSNTYNTFDVTIIDLMQFLVPLIRKTTNTNNGQFLDVDEFNHNITNLVEYYMNSGNNPNAPSIGRAVVVLLDSITNVPKNKVTTQQSRDNSCKSTITLSKKTCNDERQVKSQIDDEDEDEENENQEEDDVIQKDCILDEIGYLELLKRLNMNDENNHIIIKYDMKTSVTNALDRFPISHIDETTIRRSLNLKWQLYRMITHELLQLNTRNKEKVLIIDEGIAIDKDHYENVRKTIIQNHHFEDNSDFEKECLVANVVLKNLVQRLISYEDGTFVRNCNNQDVGEADIKLLQYIALGNGASKFLVVSQDTDIIFILLLHMKRLLNPETRLIDDKIEVWIDTQTLADKNNGCSRPYRYINMKKLYMKMYDFFRSEYSQLQHPLELFVFLVNSLKTDFTSAFHSNLMITPRVIWNAFSELHYNPKETKTKHLDYVLFSGRTPTGKPIEITRCAKRNYTSSLSGVLNKAITLTFNPTTQTFDSTIRTELFEKFFYLLCQKKLITDLGSIGYTNYQKSNIITQAIPYISDPNDIFIMVNELTTKINEFKNTSSSNTSNNIQTPTQLSKQVSKPKLNSSFKPSFSSNPVTTNSHIGATKQQQAFLKKLSNKEIPKNYGIPTITAMKARIYRTHWILEYFQNGSISSKYIKNQANTSNMDPSLSQWGWICMPLENPSIENYNSSYYVSVFNENYDKSSGGMPLKLYTMVETDNIYDRENS
jgi:hypothetical protein